MPRPHERAAPAQRAHAILAAVAQPRLVGWIDRHADEVAR
jgi:hypothetical protein